MSRSGACLYSARMLQRLSKLWGMFRRDGVYSTIQRVCASGAVPKKLFYLGHVRIFVLDRFNEKAVARKLNDYTIRRADASALEAIVNCSQDSNPEKLRKVFSSFFDAGHSCYLATHVRDGVVAYNWAFRHEYTLTFDEYESKNVAIDLSEDCVFCGNGFVASTHRLKGIFAHLAHRRIQSFPEQSCFYVSVADINMDSLNANRRLGYREICSVICICIFGLNLFLRLSDQLPYWWSFGRANLHMRLK